MQFGDVDEFRCEDYADKSEDVAALLVMSPLSLKETVEAIERALAAVVRSVASEDVWVTYYGAYDIHSRHLGYWVCVKTDAEKHCPKFSYTLETHSGGLIGRHIPFRLR
jgi:hypothetical protein